MANLRGYQSELNSGIRNAWQQGHRVVMGVLPTGGGKTVCMGDIARGHDGYGCAIAHRSELVSQISKAYAREGIVHKVIAADKTWRGIQAEHYEEFGRSYLNQSGNPDWAVASVDTIIKRPNEKIFNRATLAIEDEGHHALKANKWGRVFTMFGATCLGLLLTATPIRTDGAGLGKSFDGIVDMMIEGPGMRWMIDQGFLTDYDVYCPTVRDLNLKDLKTTALGELSKTQIADIFAKSKQIVGDVVRHYLELAPGKLGITFAANINEAQKITDAFNAAGVPAALVTADSSDDERRSALRRFKNRELLQLVNVDLFGEGFDLPAIEVVSMARPTASLSLFYQQFGRSLRLMISPILQAAWDTYTPQQRLAFIAQSDKPKAIVIDHVGNLHRHLGPPDKHNVWSLAPKSRKGASDAIPLRSCEHCHKPFLRIHRACTWCGKDQSPPEPAMRASPKLVDGDLGLVSLEELNKMRGEIRKIDGPVYTPQALEGTPAAGRLQKVHAARQRAQLNLRHVIACWAGMHRSSDQATNERRFFHTFNIDVLSAAALPAADANTLRHKITMKMTIAGVLIYGLPFPDDDNQQEKAA